MQLIYTVCKDIEEAREISKELVSAKLAGCANFWKINSVYNWEDELKESEEVAVLIKTRVEYVSDVFSKIKQLHSYEAPAIFVLPTGVADNDYLEWLQKATTQ